MSELTPGEVRTFVENLDELRETLRDTHAADPGALMSVVVSFDGYYNVATATGSADLCAHAVSEALTSMAPYLVQSSYVRVELRYAGYRLGHEPAR